MSGDSDRRPRIVLLDSGVDPRHRTIVDRGVVSLGPAVSAAGEEQAHGPDRLGHGTAVAAAILDLCPDAALHSIQVFDREPACTVAAVLAGLQLALRWRPQWVNLSLGTTDAFAGAQLAECVAMLRRHAVHVVAPAHDSGRASYPGTLSDVLGVVDDPNVPRLLPQQREVQGRAWWFASPFPPGVEVAPHDSGVSLATAHVTGYLAHRQRR